MFLYNKDEEVFRITLSVDGRVIMLVVRDSDKFKKLYKKITTTIYGQWL